MTGRSRGVQRTNGSSARSWAVPAGAVLAAAVLLAFFPQNSGPSLDALGQFALEMVYVMPAVLVVMGLFSVWVPKEMVVRHLGEGTGARGIALSLLLGTLPTGPLYAAFPLARSLLDKGALTANAFVFLAAWACIKIPQELVELKFLGWQFTLARFIFTVIVVVALAFVFKRVLEGRDGSV